MVDAADIRGLVTALLDSVKRVPQSKVEGRPKPAHNWVEDCVKPGPRGGRPCPAGPYAAGNFAAVTVFYGPAHPVSEL